VLASGVNPANDTYLRRPTQRQTKYQAITSRSPARPGLPRRAWPAHDGSFVLSPRYEVLGGCPPIGEPQKFATGSPAKTTATFPKGLRIVENLLRRQGTIKEGRSHARTSERRAGAHTVSSRAERKPQHERGSTDHRSVLHTPNATKQTSGDQESSITTAVRPVSERKYS